MNDDEIRKELPNIRLNKDSDIFKQLTIEALLNLNETLKNLAIAYIADVNERQSLLNRIKWDLEHLIEEGMKTR